MQCMRWTYTYTHIYIWKSDFGAADCVYGCCDFEKMLYIYNYSWTTWQGNLLRTEFTAQKTTGLVLETWYLNNLNVQFRCHSPRSRFKFGRETLWISLTAQKVAVRLASSLYLGCFPTAWSRNCRRELMHGCADEIHHLELLLLQSLPARGILDDRRQWFPEGKGQKRVIALTFLPPKQIFKYQENHWNQRWYCYQYWMAGTCKYVYIKIWMQESRMLRDQNWILPIQKPPTTLKNLDAQT